MAVSLCTEVLALRRNILLDLALRTWATSREKTFIPMSMLTADFSLSMLNGSTTPPRQ